MTTDFELPEGTQLRQVRLRIRDLGRSLRFYQDLLGLRVVTVEGRRAGLSATGSPPAFLVLEEEPDAPPRPTRTTGLYHVAILFPNRRSLGRAFLRLQRAGWPFDGFSDHLVSWALYLPDPDGNGLELYADRPREAWRWHADQVVMATLPLDLDALVAEAEGADGALAEVPADTRIGHIHLNVADLRATEDFYHRRLGMAVTARNYPGARFFAAGRYHHHVGANIWQGPGAPPPPPEAIGLVGYSLALPDRAALARLARQLEASGTAFAEEGGALRVVDPDGVPVLFTAEG
jgi:catechol 2,3-dioxygenase